MSTPTAIPIADARVSRLSRMPITVLVGIDTANIPPAIANATKAKAPARLQPEQRRGAADGDRPAPGRVAEQAVVVADAASRWRPCR